MNQEINKILFMFLRSAVSGSELKSEELAQFDEKMLPELFEISKKHNISHLLSVGLSQNNLAKSEEQFLTSRILGSVVRYEQLSYELDKVCNIFESAKIPFLPLKGSVIRKFYPEPWMRSSSDIDILIKEEDIKKATDILSVENGYTFVRKGSHDVLFYTPNNQHIELHYHLIEKGRLKNSDEILKNVWQNSSVREGYGYWYEMSDEMFYFYHIVHMAKHFEGGGCGIRSFIDLHILDNVYDDVKEKRDKLLKKGDLLKFAKKVRKLSRVWFLNEEHDEITMQIENYIVQGGVFGTKENRIAMFQQKKGGAMAYALSKIFIPYDVLKYHYPILEKHRWLMPFMHVRRWFKLAFLGHAKRTMYELKYNAAISSDEAQRTQQFMKNVGLL